MELLECWKPVRYYRSSSGKIDEFSNIEVSISGKIRYVKTKQPVSILIKGSDYPYVSIYTGKTKVSRLRVHTILISTFTEPPNSPGYTVDHINRDRLDYRLTNLRFLSISDNLKNRNMYTKPKIYFKIKGNSPELVDKDNISKNDSIISITKDMYERLLRSDDISLLDIISDDYQKVLNTKFYMSKSGVIKRTYKYGDHYTFGTKVKLGYYVHGIKLPKGYSSFVHGLMAVIYLNNGHTLGKSDVVDHIDTNPGNNSVSNLRIVTQKENLNNKLTKEKLQIPIKCLNVGKTVYFGSLTDCAKLLGLNHPGSVCDWVNGRYKCTIAGFSNFEYLSIEELKNIKNLHIITDKSELVFLANIRKMGFEDIQKFIVENKILNRSMLYSNYKSFYRKLSRNGWLSSIVYYESKEGED